MHARPVLVAAFLGLFLATTAGAAVDAGSSVGFRFLPQKTFQGQPASLSVIARPSGVRCVPTIRYADGKLQVLKAAIARGNRATWNYKVPGTARIGKATATVRCGRAGKNTRGFTVVGPPAAPAKVELKKSGFSQRVRPTSRNVSYGIVLSNASPEKDALAIAVIINFIDSSNRVVQTKTDTIAAIGAGSDYYLGGGTSIPDGTPVSSLEIVTRVGGQDMATKLGPPSSDVLVQQARYDPGWVGAVVGQVENDHPGMMLSAHASISTVIFDASGNVLGGSRGASTGDLLPGVRAYWSASSGANSVPIDKAASAGVSVLGKYVPVS